MATSTARLTRRPVTTVRRVERAAFQLLNRFMVPFLRTGLARYIGSPITGYFLLLRTTGRRSGLPRYTPLNYVIAGGSVCILAGFGEGTHWLANLRENAGVWVKLPAREFEGTAEVVRNSYLARRLAVAVARNCGFALVFEDPACLFMSDGQLARRLDGRPVVLIRPDGDPVEPGPHDPGGSGWTVSFGVQMALMALLWRLLRRRGS